MSSGLVSREKGSTQLNRATRQIPTLTLSTPQGPKARPAAGGQSPRVHGSGDKHLPYQPIFWARSSHGPGTGSVGEEGGVSGGETPEAEGGQGYRSQGRSIQPSLPPSPASPQHLFLLQVPKFLVDHPENLLHGLGLDGAGAGCGVLRSRCGGGPGPRCSLTPGGPRRGWRAGRLAAASAVAGGRGHLQTVKGREREKKKAGGRTERRVRRRTGRDAGQNAQRAGACASVGGGAAARAARAGRDSRRVRARPRDPPAGRPARPRPAPAPPRGGRRHGLPAPGHPGSRWGRGQRPVQRSPRGRAAGTVAFPGREGRELGARRLRRVEKGTGNALGGEEGMGRRLEDQAPGEGLAGPKVQGTRDNGFLPLLRLGPGWRSPCARGGRWRSRGGKACGAFRAVSCAPRAQAASPCPRSKCRC